MQNQFSHFSESDKKVLLNALIEYRNTLDQHMIKINSSEYNADEKSEIRECFQSELRSVKDKISQIRQVIVSPGYLSRVVLQNYWI